MSTNKHQDDFDKTVKTFFKSFTAAVALMILVWAVVLGGVTFLIVYLLRYLHIT